MYQLITRIVALVFFIHFVFSSCLKAHEGPDPIMHWKFNSKSIREGRVLARLGKDAQIIRPFRVLSDDFGGSIYLRGGTAHCVVEESLSNADEVMPKQDLTISAWVSVDEGQDDGGIVSFLQDNGNSEQGWLLGYDQNVFTFALASKGASDEDGRLTYLKGSTPYTKGQVYHLVAVYDGTTMELYVNGKLDASSTEQHGEILYPKSAPFVLGAYRDQNELYPLKGTLREIAIYDRAAKAAWVEHDFVHGKNLVTLRPSGNKSGAVDFVVQPYLQYATQTQISIAWQVNKMGTAKVCFGEDSSCAVEKSCDSNGLVQNVTLTELKPETQYFYRVEIENGGEEFVESEVSTFVTAVHDNTPFAFAVIGDTQGNPEVASKIAGHAWAQRPSFAVHAGDLVDAGKRNTDWTQQFFPSMNELIRRVPLYPVLGNHEQNATNYFDYMVLPEPEYWYQFKFGNAQFFMIDSNRNVDPDSEQYAWLEKNLSESTATWKFACHHHPPYSSDENDYGDLWKTNKSTRGDTRVRALVPLYEKYKVDIVWNGHIHSYERTWPVHEGQPVQKDAPVYVVTGGGGGGLETAGPVRPFFQNNVKRGHHYVMVYINGSTMEFKAFDLEGNLFDTFSIQK